MYNTWQVNDSAEDLFIELGYEDEDPIPNELFHLLRRIGLVYTNESGVRPAESLDDLQDLNNGDANALTNTERQRLINILLNDPRVTPGQQSELKRYTNLGKTTASHEDTPDESTFEGRVDEYDEYWVAVDLTRFLGQLLNDSDATAKNTGNSKLAREYTKYKQLKNVLKQECSNMPGTLPLYKEEIGPKSEWKVMTKEHLKQNGVEIPGQEKDSIAKFEFKSYHDDIALPGGYDIPEVWSQSELVDEQDVSLEDLPEKTREALLKQAYRELANDMIQLLEEKRSDSS
ncbi:hypothetical protein BRC86_10785 [Halobacteriales archaeon QS_3_64_16]|nr:MAG: hypothetical protein BRC86_10785 [Halobacteriales archaeon QS_3_64_16]